MVVYVSDVRKSIVHQQITVFLKQHDYDIDESKEKYSMVREMRISVLRCHQMNRNILILLNLNISSIMLFEIVFQWNYTKKKALPKTLVLTPYENLQPKLVNSPDTRIELSHSSPTEEITCCFYS